LESILGVPSPYVSWELRDDVWTVSINRPQMRNALDSAMYGAIKLGVRLGSAETRAAVIVIRGCEGSFAVGGDLEGLLSLVDRGPEQFRASFEEAYHDPLPWPAVLGATKPVVAAIDGFCVAGGLLLAMCCDLAIATDRSRFGIPEARVGIADKSTVELLAPSIGLMRTRYLALTGKMIDAVTAERWGLISLCVQPQEFESALVELIDDLRLCSPSSQRAYKSLVNERIGSMPSDLLMDVALTADAREGLSAFREKRRPDWPSRRRVSPGP
jgi:enoyl-CoA hydratase/carnithine racemase